MIQRRKAQWNVPVAQLHFLTGATRSVLWLFSVSPRLRGEILILVVASTLSSASRAGAHAEGCEGFVTVGLPSHFLNCCFLSSCAKQQQPQTANLTVLSKFPLKGDAPGFAIRT